MNRKRISAPRPSGEGAPVTLTIDGRAVTVPEGTSVMRAAAEVGGSIPSSAPPTASPASVHAGCAWSRSKVCAARRRRAPPWCAQGMVVQTQTPRLEKLRRGVMELYISDHPLDCLTCSANNDCELQDMAAQCRPARRALWLCRGEPSRRRRSRQPRTPISISIRPKCIVCSRCVRACEEVQGTFALTIEGRGFGSRGARPAGIGAVPVVRMRLLRRLRRRPARPRRCSEKAVDRNRPAGTLRKSPPAPIAASAAPSRAEMRGEQVVRMVPWKDGKANRRSFLRQGPLRLGLCPARRPHHQADDPRRRSTDPWREVSWDEAIEPRRRASRSASQAKYGTRCARRHHLQPLHQRGDLPRAEAGARRLRHEQRRHLRARLPLAHRLLASARPSAPRQARRTSNSVEDADVILVIGANPTDGHPVFASRA